MTALSGSTTIANVLAPSGHLRAAINFGNGVLAQRDAQTGAPRGVSVDLARELGRRLGLPVDLITFDGAGNVTDALKTHDAGAAYVRAFVEELKASGFVARALAASGQTDASVAPAST